MRNILKFSLLCAALCTMNIINNNAYSMESNNMETQFETAIDNIKNYGAAFPRAGLTNIGATCYINAVLQCLANDTDFVLDFLREVKYQYKNLKQRSSNKQNENDANECKMVLELANVITELWTLQFDNNGNYKQDKPCSAHNFRKIFNHLFKIEQLNGREYYLLRNLFCIIHKVLGKKNENGNNIKSDSSGAQFAFEYLKNNQSCVSNSFYFTEISKSICDSCKYGFDAYQIANYLVFPLEAIMEWKLKNNQMQIQWNNNVIVNNNAVTLHDCFDFNNKIDYCNGAYCNNCQCQTDAQNVIKMMYTPNTLAIALHRKQNNKYDIRIDIPEEADLQQYADIKTDEKNYFLSSMVCFIKGGDGTNGYSNHFITIARTTQYSPWVKYNNALVDVIEDKEELNKILSGNSNIVPHILFYKKMK